MNGNSPIAADGGFGPMNDAYVEDEPIDPDATFASKPEGDAKEDFGEDFDEFEAGAVEEEFGDFDEGFQEPLSHDDQAPELQNPTNFSRAPSLLFPFVSRSMGHPTIYPQSSIFLLSRCLSVADYQTSQAIT